MKIEPSRLGPVLGWLTVAGSAGLIVVGLLFLLNEAGAAQLYGVPLSGPAGDAYLSAAAVRDMAVGALTLVFALLRDRRAVGLCVLLGAIIPVGDGFIVLKNSPHPCPFLPLHWGGALACVLFGLFLLAGPNPAGAGSIGRTSSGGA